MDTVATTNPNIDPLELVVAPGGLWFVRCGSLALQKLTVSPANATIWLADGTPSSLNFATLTNVRVKKGLSVV